jgi:heat shock protein HspQ
MKKEYFVGQKVYDPVLNEFGVIEQITTEYSKHEMYGEIPHEVRTIKLADGRTVRCISQLLTEEKARNTISNLKTEKQKYIQEIDQQIERFEAVLEILKGE